MSRLTQPPGHAVSLAGHPWRRFVALGDSITEGCGMDPVAGVEQVSWVERVACALAESQPGLEFHNLGRRGLRAAEIREQQLARSLELQPDLVSIAAGANDMLVPEFDREGVERDLEPLYAAFAGSGSTVFTFTYMNLPGSGLVPVEAARWVSERMEVLHEAVAALAERYDAILIDLYSNRDSADAGFFSRDLQHANAAGHAWVADRVVEVLADKAPRRSIDQA